MRDRTAPPEGPALRWLLAVFLSVLVARPLLPSEGVAWLGDGLPFDMLLLVIAAGYLLWVTIRGRLVRRGNFVDLAVAALVVLMAGSAAFAAATTMNGPAGVFGDRECEPRLAVNMFWTWTGFGLTFFLTRQLVRTARDARALVGVMLALVFMVSLRGLHQVYVGLPVDRSGTEASFQLPTSLTAFIAPWLVVGVGICRNVWQRQTDLPERVKGRFKRSNVFRAVRFAALMACALPAAWYLVRSEGPTGYIVAVLGIALAPICLGGRGVAGGVWAGSTVALGLLLALAVMGLGFQSLENAGELIADRLLSWQATLAMIRKYPIVGVGPGDFQDYYTQFRFAQAREELSDPHNFVLEVWATGGTLAVAVLASVLIGFTWKTWYPSRAPRGTLPPREPIEESSSTGRSYLVAGAAAGIFLAYVLASPFGLYFSTQQLALCVLAGGAVLALAWPWIRQGDLPAGLPALGWLVLTLHLLFSGGIAFPGVASSFWVLLALGLNQSDDQHDTAPVERRPRERVASLAGFVLAAAAAVACYRTALLPVLECRAAMAQAAEPHRSAEQRIILLRRAAAADPLSAGPWIAMAQIELERIKRREPAAAVRDQFIEATRQIVFLRRRSSATWAQIGRWYRELYARGHDAADANTVVDMSRGAVFLAPNDPTLRGEFAMALEAVGRMDAARRAAQRALELDAETARPDRKLPADLRRQIEGLLPGPR